MANPSPALIVVTDLDGTLLDHHSYRWQAAGAALAALAQQRIPLIFNTSKTLAETRVLQRRIGIDQPCIVENGAGVAIPARYFPAPPDDTEDQGGYYLKTLGVPYADIRTALIALRDAQGFEFTGFGDMDSGAIAACTDLPPEDAAAAAQRQFGEPLLWHDTEDRLQQFTDAISARGLRLTRGGRFIHVTGSSDKGRAMHWLAGQYGPPRPRVMALGDGENDIPMLLGADLAVLVRSPAHEPPTWPEDCSSLPKHSRSPRPTVLLTDKPGPEGWNDAVLEVIRDLASP